MSGPLVVHVACETGDRDPTSHPVTVTEDWALISPHDLAAERVGVAFGGRCSCLELADRALPAVRHWLDLHLRRRTPEVRYSAARGWCVPVREGCECDFGPEFGRVATVEAAVAHATSPQHVAAGFGARVGQMTSLVSALRSRHAEEVRRMSRSPALDEAVRRPAAGQRLWASGIHPTEALDLLGLVPSVRGRVPISFLLGVTYLDGWPSRQADLAPLTDGEQASRLVWARASPYPARPLAYAALLAPGRLDPGSAREVMEAGFDGPTIQRYAEAIERVRGRPVGPRQWASAAQAVLQWRYAGCEPTLDDLVALGPVRPPSPELVRWACDSSAVREAGLSPTEVGLLIAVTGSVEVTDDAVRNGIRTPAGLRSWQRQRRDH
ncbi:hypothetical protein [Nocardioides ultimimeridianus]